MPVLNQKGDAPRSFPVVTLHAPGGAGKTRAAGTASEFYRLQDPVKEMVHLSDLLFLQFDVDGHRSLQSIGCEADVLDFSEQPVDMPIWLSGVLEQLKKLSKAVKEKQYYAVVTDTLTSAASYITTYHLSRQSNAQLGYGKALADFRMLLLHIRALPARHIFLVHSKAYVEPTEKGEVAKSNTLLPGDFALKLGLTYSSAEIVRTVSSLVAGVDVNDKTGKRTLVTQPDGLFEAKSRYGNIIAAREDVNLRSIFDRIDAFDAQIRQ